MMTTRPPLCPKMQRFHANKQQGSAPLKSMLEDGKGKMQFFPGWSGIQKMNIIPASQKLQHCSCCFTFPFSQSKARGIFT